MEESKTTDRPKPQSRSAWKPFLGVIGAALVFAAILASPALAAPEWYVKTGGVWNKVTSAKTVNVTTGLWSILDEYKGVTGEGKTQFQLGAVCTLGGTGGAMKVTIEPGGKGTISEYKSTCKGMAGTVCPSESSTINHIYNIPWKTELYTVGTEIRQRIVSGGGGTPEFSFECDADMFTDTCPLASAAALNFEGNPYVRVKYSPTTRVSCSYGGHEFGRWEGELRVAAPAGTEGIQVK